VASFSDETVCSGNVFAVKYYIFHCRLNVSRYAAPMGHFKSAKEFYSLVLKFYQANQKDVSMQCDDNFYDHLSAVKTFGLREDLTCTSV
jgi:hypothetical protein